MNFILYINSGGIVAWILLVMYFIVCAIVLERILFFWNTRANFTEINTDLQCILDSENINKIINSISINRYQKSTLVTMILYYINNLSRSQKAFDEKIDREGFILVEDMEENLWILSQISFIAPLLGLLGTVLGLINSFRIMSTLGADADVSSFASGIWEAMITTAAGLIVAILSVIAYKVFENIVQKRSNQLSKIVSLLNEHRFSQE
ncbi:MAG: MotA/TolQ/ExbB proton channel family protein [Brevinema sp.]